MRPFEQDYQNKIQSIFQRFYQEKLMTAEEAIELVDAGDAIVLAAAGNEPKALTQALNTAKHFEDNRLYRMLAASPIIDQPRQTLKQYSFFLSGYDRKAMKEGKVELIPAHFSEVPAIIKRREKEVVLMSQVSPMDEKGYFSFGITAAYTTALLEEAKSIIVEVNENMPHTHGRGMRIHISQITALIEHNSPVMELPEIPISEKDLAIGRHVASIVKDGDTIQIGFGSIPNAVMQALGDKKNLGIHTEMLPSTAVKLFQEEVITNGNKTFGQNKFTTTLALGDRKLYDFMDNNPNIELLPVDYTNSLIELAKLDNLVSVNTTLEVDFLGQCNSEKLEHQYYSSTGGQADFAVGARLAKNGIGIVCLYSTAKDDTISRIVPHLHSGSPVSTSKNDVDIIVTEYGIAYLKGKSIPERVQALINVAHPNFRQQLLDEARKIGYFIDEMAV